MKRLFAFSAFVLVSAYVSAAALDGMPDGKWWKNPRAVRTLGLTASQVDEIETIFLHVRPQLIDLRADLEKKKLVQDSLMERPDVKTEEAGKAIDETERARSRLEKERAMMFLQIRQVLTPEQRQKILERREDLRERRLDRPRRLRPGAARPPDAR
ncbi:MAG: Spy/CpxP family protein refolding chaperone [Thermoanaerobaculia bacterium]